MALTKEEQDRLLFAMDNEGFGYTFCEYSNWVGIKDQTFHKFREAYLKAKQELRSYIEDGEA